MRDQVLVLEFLGRVSRRVALFGLVGGVSAGLVIAATVGRQLPVTAALVMAGAVLGLLLSRASAAAIARRVERRAPECRNLVVTASELAAGSLRASPGVAALVYRDASEMVGRLDIATLFPARRALGAFAASAALWSLVSFGDRLPVALQPVGAPVGALAIHGVEVVVTPPGYSGLPAQRHRDPSRLEVLEGSVISLAVRANAAGVTVELVDGSRQLDGDARTGFSGEITATSDGFVAVTAADSTGETTRRLIGLAVTPDAAPRVRISAPGRDLFIDSVRTALDVTIDAQDDLGLASLALRYTKVSGSGEQFTFVDGEVPLQVNRTAAGQWSARGTLPLPNLSLGAGDVVVYRAVARDNRPGAPPSESDAFLVELTSPVGAIAGGFAIDDEEDRYGVSQQMVIQMTERLTARRSELSAADFARESQTLAAAQRRVRAEFVFMLGGELAEDVGAESGLLELHEEAHVAADEDEAIAGRLRNQARLDLLRAIRAMSRAATALNETNPVGALPDEREALTLLQRAFSRTRYILRTLTERERIDLGRRLTGSLAAAARDARPVDSASVTPRAITLRRVLADVASIAGAVELTADDGDRLTVMAQSVLRLDASSPPLQAAATLFSDASAAIRGADAGSARALLDSAATVLARSLRSELRPSPRDPGSMSVRAMAGALADALRGRGGGQ